MSKTSNDKALKFLFLTVNIDEQLFPMCWGATGLLISTVFRGELVYIRWNLGRNLWPDLGSSGQVPAVAWKGWLVGGES